MKYHDELVNQKTWLIHLKIDKHWEKLRLNVTKLSESDIVLDILWLRSINLMIDWVNETIVFLETEMTQLYSILQSSQNVKIFVMTSEKMRLKFQETRDAQILWSREIQKEDHTKNSAIAQIFKEYKKYQFLFEQENDQDTLLKHQSWDHEIKLVDEKEFTKQFIYSLLTEKLDALRQYLKENMRKEFIKESQSSVKYSILFILKSNKSLKLCVDYRALNNIIVKNSYSLSLISELQDRLQKAQWFTKFDILEAFNRIRIKKEDE